MKVEIYGDWKDELIWCPSQCYLRISYGDVNWMIYLRWRYQDPWTAYLVKCDLEWDMHIKGDPWINIFDSEDYFKDDCNLDELKERAIFKAKKILYSGEWLLDKK